MNEYRCPHGRIHINGGDLLSYHERLDEWGNKAGYRLFIDGTVQCSDCTAIDTDKLAAGIQLRNELHEADRSFRRTRNHALPIGIRPTLYPLLSVNKTVVSSVDYK
jgi:hypothetical protein